MSNELIAVLVGGLIGTVGSLSTTYLLSVISDRKRSKSIQAIAEMEIVAIKEKAERYLAEKSSYDELSASTPMLTSIASELGFLSKGQAIALRRCITLDMELRKKGNKEKAKSVIEACNQALHELIHR